MIRQFKERLLSLVRYKQKTEIKKEEIIKENTIHPKKDKSEHHAIIHEVRNEGSAKKLSGSIYILSIFASDTAWSEENKYELNRKLFEAEEWLKKEASKYGARITFKNGQFGYEKTVNMAVATGKGTGKENSRVAHKAMKVIGYNSLLQFYEWVKNEEKCDNCLIIVFTKGYGRDYAVSYAPQYGNDFFTESCVIYEHCENGEPVYTSTIAHEILHCFGAEDLYETFIKPKEVENLAKKKYPNDIMHRTDYNINNLNIGGFTAWCVGLTERYKNEFNILLRKK